MPRVAERPSPAPPPSVRRSSLWSVEPLLGAAPDAPVEAGVVDAGLLATRTIAVDWSGARTGAERKIWLCEVRDGRVVRLEHGRSREGVVAHLAAEAARDPRLVVGLDFAFSFPAWFVAQHGGSATALWTAALVEGERWLSGRAAPFWGRRDGARRDASREQFRHTEQEIAATTGLRPKSVFQVGGAGSVGTGSIRGMPCLAHLREAGFAIWPFDPVRPGVPVVLEIWPRLCYAERVVKAQAVARAGWLARHAPALGLPHRSAAEECDDAFDALAAGMALWQARGALAALPAPRDAREALEGRIWAPLAPRTPGQPLA